MIEPNVPAAKDLRRHDLDALRASAMLLGIVYHASLSLAWGFTWLVADSKQSTWVFVFQAMVHGFRMPLFFLISGFFTAMLWRKRGLKSLLWNRFVRVFVPCMIGLMTVGPAMSWAFRYATRKPPSSANATVDNDFWTILKRGDVQAIEERIQAGEDLNQVEPALQLLPLSWAALHNQPRAVEVLIRAGVDVNQTNQDGETALHAAAFFGYNEVVDVLIQNGADIDAKNKKGETPLHHARLDSQIVKYISDLIGKEFDANSSKVNRAQVASKMEQLGGHELPAPGSKSGGANLGGLLLFLMYAPIFGVLWFLWFLCWFAVVFAIYAVLANWLGWKIPHAFLLSSWTLAGLAAITLIPQYFMGRSFAEFGPDTSLGILPLPHVFAYYLLFFGFGALYYDCGDDTGRLGRSWRWALPLSFLVLFPLGLDFRTGLIGIRQYLLPPSGYEWGAIVCQVLYAWTMAFGCMGMFRAMLTRERRWIRYMSDASYWLYLTHLPLIIVGQHWIKNWHLPGLLKLFMLVTVVVGLLLIVYQLMVRHTWIGWVLNGRRK